ncbi:MAG TPA: bifunctional helix-turn-helix transcriptional regulator/GNAT family N-acetyltransferase [Phenylobacterium sp.]|jgi:DNA-binding MarR family transcriptional regulator/GNAT superfamily N-acetyltransferase|uniref:bifunctional helix-turn-helix transcriptional regulator/GNAT family N-acetyltransferase n=1 Tax=Phenylobacterium sp. TaxID=1871053 RepID=UPI002BA1A003|nr:bifunctional helix-turn-helix transcriptional regulator/GNAT family N-acetyltransferase [Phenylobacterium sp.]HXA39073.1 bifunctional helix-turn-helix transcriptional regulator/GNAT family N-acetyltransferase [Phenylobacterium sp.]
MSVELSDPVAAVRRFNRFYTRAIGVLEKGYLGTPYTVAEGRVLYEIAKADGITAKAVGEIAGLDAGYLSRIVARLERDGVVARERSAEDGRSALLRLTPHGAAVFEPFDQRSAALVEGLIGGLSSRQRQRLTAAMAEVEALLDAPAPVAVTLRPHRNGDMGWITERHGVNYAREYGWNGHIEAVTARICADFLDRHDPALERCWIAERGGERLGCVFLVKDEVPGVARLRLLMLEPAARGLGLGRRLVEECIAFARAAGYREVVLWTHAVLIAARAIYAATGFELEATWTHDAFGAPEVSETWRLKLSGA